MELKLKKSTQKILIAAGIALVVIVAAYFFYLNGPEISVTGSSSLKVKPDLISIHVTIGKEHAYAETAQNAVSIISEKLLAELAKFGLKDEDIELSNYYVYPKYDWVGGQQELAGYVASQQMIVKMESVEKIIYVVPVIADTDAMITGINYELSSSKQNEYKAQALNEAGQDAENKARALASGVGKRLGRLVSVQSQDFGYYPYPIYARAEADTLTVANAAAEKTVSSLDVSARSMDISASVSATYTLTRF